MHWEAFNFVEVTKTVFPRSFRSSAVLEIGSSDVNGSIRQLFVQPTDYIGADLSEGPGVDLVGSGHEIALDCDFDVAISCECFEHNPYYLETFENMVRHTKAGGMVVFTCATTGRPEHGTRGTNAEDSPGTSARGWDYYKNLVPNDFPEETLDRHFRSYRFFESPHSQDVYFCGVVKGGDCDAPIASNFIRLEQRVEHLLERSALLHDFEVARLSSNDLTIAEGILDQLPNPRSLILSHRLIRIFMRKGLFDLTLDEISRAEDAWGSIASMSKQKWQSLSRLGRPQEAIPIAERTLESEGRLPADLMVVAWLYRQAGDLPRAEEFLREALLKNPNDPETGYRLSVVTKERGDTEAALAHIVAVLEMAPPTATYLFHYARICRANREFAKAKSALQDAISLEPNVAAYRNELEAITAALA